MNRPSAAVLVVFVAVVLIGGTNFVAVRFSNRELPPFWGAGLRFAIAGALLVGFAAWRHIRLPLGSRFAGVALLGSSTLDSRTRSRTGVCSRHRPQWQQRSSRSCL